MSEEVDIKGGDSSGGSPSICIDEKGSRNKRKFLYDDPKMSLGSCPDQCLDYEFSVEQFLNNSVRDQSGLCNLCNCSLDNPDDLKLELGLSSSSEPSELGPVQPRVEQDAKGLQDSEWSDPTESQLEELCLNNLDSIFKSAIKMIAAAGYSEDVATKAVLRTEIFYGCKDTVSNIVNNTLAILQSGQENDASRDHPFENLEQLEKYILAEMVCVLREVNPLFNIGDAMWCLLICDMNVSHACAMDGDSLNCLGTNELLVDDLTVSVDSQSNSTANDSEENHLNSSTSNSPVPSPIGSQPELPAIKGIPNLPISRNSLACEGKPQGKVSPTSTSNKTKKALNVIEERVQVKSQYSSSAEKPVGGKKGHSGNAKRESILRQKIQLEKSYRGALRTGKLGGFGGLILDKKLKSVSDSIGMHPKNASMKIKKSMEVSISHAEGNRHLTVNVGTSNSSASDKKTVNTQSVNVGTSNSLASDKKTVDTQPVNVGTSSSSAPNKKTLNTRPEKTVNTQLVLPKANKEPSLLLPSKSNAAPNLTAPSAEIPDYSLYGIPYDKTIGKWVPNDKQDEVILRLATRAHELQNQLGEWIVWANQKVLQATRRLSKDKSELKALRQEKEELERIQKEQQTLKDNNTRKLSEMDNALSKATEKVEQDDVSVRMLEVQRSKLKQEMEEAKKRYEEATANFKVVSKRKEKIMKKLQSSEGLKISLQEELAASKSRRVQLEQEVEPAKKFLNHFEARQKQVKKEKDEFLLQAESIRKEREQSEISAKSEENRMKMESGNHLRRFKVEIQNLESRIAQLTLKTDPSKMATLDWSTDGSLANKSAATMKGGIHQTSFISKLNEGFQYNVQTKHVKRERECVMCLTEEKSVVFLPCSHQVVCITCNELHEKQGMKDCPSCRTHIHNRISARFYSSTN